MIKRVCAVAVLATVLPGRESPGDVLSHWRFDEVGGTVAEDSAGDVDGTLMGGASFAPDDGIAGGAISLARASADLVDFGDVYPFTGGVNCSIAVWVRTSETINDTFPIARHTGGTLNGYILILNRSACYGATGAASAYFSAGCGQEPISTTTVTNGEWHHLVMTYDMSGTTRIFVDGAPEDSGPAPQIQPNSATLLLGGLYIGSTPTAFYTGLIDDTQIYDHAATPAQVQSMFEHPGETLPACPADVGKDGGVAFDDILVLLSVWGCQDCPEDLTGDGTVTFADLLVVLAEWGPCPVVE